MNIIFGMLRLNVFFLVCLKYLIILGFDLSDQIRSLYIADAGLSQFIRKNSEYPHLWDVC